MDSLLDLIPVLIFLLFGIVQFVRSSKGEDTPHKPVRTRRNNGGNQQDYEAARNMLEELKRRVDPIHVEPPNTLGGIELMSDGEEPLGQTREDAYMEDTRTDAFAPANSGENVPEAEDYMALLQKVRESDAYTMPSHNVFADANNEVVDVDEGDAFAISENDDSTDTHKGAFKVCIENRDDLRRAFVVSEIISKPLALRETDERIAVW